MSVKVIFVTIVLLVAAGLTGCGRVYERPYYSHGYRNGTYYSMDEIQAAVPAAEALRSEVLNSVPVGGRRTGGHWSNTVEAGADTRSGESANFRLRGRTSGEF